MTTLPTALLVHGAWHGPWAWDELRPALQAQGWPTQVVALPSSATIDPEATGAGVEEDAAVVRAALQDIDGPVVVLAHSYGGDPRQPGDHGRAERGARGLPCRLPARCRGEHVLHPR